jgi:hypothetical protein
MGAAIGYGKLIEGCRKWSSGIGTRPRPGMCWFSQTARFRWQAEMRVSQNEALHQIAPPAEQAIPIDDMIIRSMTPGNAKGLCVRRETSEASEYRRKCSERNKGPEVAALLLAMAICKAQFYWLHFRPGSQDCATLCFSLSLNILPVVLLTRCSRVHAGQVTASKLSVRSVGAVSGSQT